MDPTRSYYAARFREAAPGGDVVERLVVVAAQSVDEARRESALIEADFHPASDDELDEWEAKTDVPLNLKDLRQLERLVRRELVALANKRARSRAFSPDDPSSGRRGRYKARKLAQLRGKLELLLEDAEDAEDAEPEVEVVDA